MKREFGFECVRCRVSGSRGGVPARTGTPVAAGSGGPRAGLRKGRGKKKKRREREEERREDERLRVERAERNPINLFIKRFSVPLLAGREGGGGAARVPTGNTRRLNEYRRPRRRSGVNPALARAGERESPLAGGARGRAPPLMESAWSKRKSGIHGEEGDCPRRARYSTGFSVGRVLSDLREEDSEEEEEEAGW